VKTSESSGFCSLISYKLFLKFLLFLAQPVDVCNTVAVVEVAVLGSKRRKLSDITEMDLVAGAVHRVVTNFTYV